MLSLRNSLEKAEREEKSKKITEKVIELLLSRGIKSVLLYASYGSEVETWKIFEFCRRNSIRTAFPKVSGNNIEIYWVNHFSQLVPGFRSILEPLYGKGITLSEIELILVPGIAFDLRCFRIGYGGGFYDRLLKERDSLAIGLAYDEQIIEKIPNEPFDQKVDLIITDKRSISCV